MHRMLPIVVLVSGLFAQDYRARVQGVVSDSSGAVIPGAKVVLRNQNTGFEATRQAGATGHYLFDAVEPGRYTVSAESTGFARSAKSDVAVQTRADVTVDLALQPGQLTESVTVTTVSEEVRLQFNSSTRELTVDGKMLQELPVKARNPFTLALLDPAVVNRYSTAFERNPFFMWSSSSIDVGGNTNRKNDLLLDGAPIQLNQKGSYAPPMDAVQEFSIQQNSVDAEFGHSAGGILSVSVKSGTNRIHGTAYYFGRNPALNAVTNSVTRQGNFVRNHIWGGTVGGPVRKNRLFNFTSYEGWRTKEPRSTLRTLPTDLERRGDFSQSQTIFNTQRSIFDPWTSRLNVANNTGSRTPFPGNVIPPSRIDPTAALFMRDIWSPNGAGDNITGINNFRTNYSWSLANWNFNNRTDWNISEKLRVFGRYSRLRTDLEQNSYVDSPAVTRDNDGIMNSRNLAGDLVYTHSARTIINVRGSFASLEDDYNAPNGAIGEAGLAKYWPSNAWYQPYAEGMPAIYYPQLSIGNATFGRSSYWIQHPRSWNLSGKVSRIAGNHYLKYGGETRQNFADGRYPDLMSFTFGAGLTAETFIGADVRRSGDAYATFLLGTLDSGSYTRFIAPQSIHIGFLGAFFQDDWKITRRVTLNLGLRYEYSTPPVDSENRYSRFLDLTQPVPEIQQNPPNIPADILALRTAPPIYNGAWVFTDDKNRGVYQTQKLTLMPRIGTAIRVNDETAVQIGWARYVTPPNLASLTIERIAFPGFSVTTNTLATTEGRPQSVLSRPFGPGVNPLLPVQGKSLGRYTNLGAGASWDNQSFQPPTNERINFTIQRGLPGGFRADATYFFNYGHDLAYTRQLNLTDPRLSYTHKALLSQNVPNPFQNYLTPEKFPGAQRTPAVVSRASLLRPYPQYGGLGVTNTPGVSSVYQALQLRVQRVYKNGAGVLFSYNYNRERTTGFYNGDHEYDRQWSWIPSTNPRHRMNLSGTYDLPVGRGRAFGSGMPRAVDYVIGGWSASSILTFNSGGFLRFGGMDVTGDPRIPNPTPQRRFDTSVFRIQTPFTPRANPLQYEGLTGPFFWNWDSTLSKTLSLTEQWKLELRFEAYNTTNSFIWNDPALGVTSAVFGRSTNQANRGREFQYTMRLRF